MEFKEGDRVKVKDTQNVRKYNKRAIGHEFVITKESAMDLNLGNKSAADPYNTHRVNYLPTDLEIITTMKNLLETEFVIENCTLSQRLAIKAYCDEKKIECFITYSNLEAFVNKYAHIEYNITPVEGATGFCGVKEINKKVITFSELIQFLDKYQPEPEFKVGDFIYYDGSFHKAGPYLLKEKISDGEFKDSNNETRDIKESNGAYRHATPEEIKKWKEENEFKLPRINQYDGKVDRDFIIYGNNCAKLKISWFKNIGDVSSFLNIGENRTIRSIKLNSDVEITIAHIEQIKKFIEHNKL